MLGDDSRDGNRALRAFIGMAGPTAVMMLILMLASTAAMLQRHLESANDPLLVSSCYVLIGLGAVVVLLMPDDPLPFLPTAFVVAIGPLTTGLSVSDAAASASADYVPWTTSAYALVLSGLILRRRPCGAWTATVLSAISFGVVGYLVGISRSAVLASFAPVGTIVAVTGFALIMRPTLESLEALRVASISRAAAEATITAQLDERDRQLATLDLLARPILDKIAAGRVLSAGEREECRLLEAELRDGLRAPQLAVAPVVSAVRAARGRGVEVLLLDDGGFADVSDDVRGRVVAEAAHTVEQVREGAVTVRVLPAGKRYLASFVVSGPGYDSRTEIGFDGSVRTVENLS